MEQKILQAKRPRLVEKPHVFTAPSSGEDWSLISGSEIVAAAIKSLDVSLSQVLTNKHSKRQKMLDAQV